jgi:predicted ATP-grasp superfamily ATP-dependent carboligase
MRVLLSEGSSTSAREAVTVLGVTGHRVEICDPDPRCLGAISRFVHRVHRCPGIRDDPQGYLAFIEALLSREQFDVLIPIHEQGYVLASAPDRVRAHTAIALPSFTSYRTAVRKTDFSRLLVELALHQPPTRTLTSVHELDETTALPCVIKAAFGTASQSIWYVADRDQLVLARQQLATRGDDEFLVQDYVDGTIERAQGVFLGGRLLAMHAWRRLRSGAGGGDAIKESIERADVRSDLERLGARLGWEGALSVDYISERSTSRPAYIDCNPRLVEPMSAFLCGIDLLGLLMRVSCNQACDAVPAGRVGVRTHLGMQALLGRALAHGTRRDLLRELAAIHARTGDYASSREELTPVGIDWVSALPLLGTALALLVQPRSAARLTRRFGAHVLGTKTARQIEREGPG